jgi:hypothetical protein
VCIIYKKLLRQLPEYTGKQNLLDSTIKKIFEDINIWDEDLQVAFAESLSKSVLLLAKDVAAVTLVNMIIKFLITTVTEENTTTAIHYLRCFEEMIGGLGEKIEIKKDILDYINTLGSFGKNNKSRRYSAYFCACIFKVSYSILYF